MNKELILKLIVANLVDQASPFERTLHRPYVDIGEDTKDVVLDGRFNLDEIAETIMKEFENE